jgi:hypothetical protein
VSRRGRSKPRVGGSPAPPRPPAQPRAGSSSRAAAAPRSGLAAFDTGRAVLGRIRLVDMSSRVSGFGWRTRSTRQPALMSVASAGLVWVPAKLCRRPTPVNSRLIRPITCETAAPEGDGGNQEPVCKEPYVRESERYSLQREWHNHRWWTDVLNFVPHGQSAMEVYVKCSGGRRTR